MHKDDVDKWLKRRPFTPFVIELSTGQRIPVKHPETMYPGRMAYHIVFIKDGTYEGFADISIIHIVKIEPLNGHAGRRKRAAS